VFIEAVRARRGEAQPWIFSHIRVELERAALEQRAAARRAVAVKAGYVAADAIPAAATFGEDRREEREGAEAVLVYELKTAP
jgi:hypothetical protein